MKRIGILTFHRAHNYGAALQCYALQEFLCELGYDVKVIDYNNRDLWKGYEWYKKEDIRFALSKPGKVLRRCVKLHIKWYQTIPRYKKFVRFQEHELQLCSTNDISDNPFDLVLIGSDQVWNTDITHGFDIYYWGQFDRPGNTKVATYAASLKKIWKNEDLPLVTQYLKSLNAISVREMDVANKIIEIDSSLNPIVVPDPVFLLSANDWKKMAKAPRIKEPYVLFYQAMDSERVYDIACSIAQLRRKKLVVLSANVNGRNSKESKSSSPAEFVGWIMNADLVVTSSFHATAFSILFRKEFYTVDLKAGPDSRLKNVLAGFHLEDHFIGSFDECQEVQPFDCQERIDSLQKTASHYVKALLE